MDEYPKISMLRVKPDSSLFPTPLGKSRELGSRPITRFDGANLLKRRLRDAGINGDARSTIRRHLRAADRFGAWILKEGMSIVDINASIVDRYLEGLSRQFFPSRLGGTLPDKTLRNLVGHIMLGLSPVQHAFADTMTEVTIGYPKSPLNGPCLAGAGPKPGQRVGPLSGQVPVGAGSAPRFALFAANTTATADLVGRFPGLLDREVRPPFRDGGIWLVRPDGYLACSSSDTEAVANYLDGLLRARTD